MKLFNKISMNAVAALLAVMIICAGCDNEKEGASTESPVTTQKTDMPTGSPEAPSSSPEIIAQPDPISDYMYTIENNEATITGYLGERTAVVIPSEINGSKVISIGAGAFRGCANLTSVTIPNGLTSIGMGAFLNCANLASIAIPDSVTAFGRLAFNGTLWYKNLTDEFIVVNNVLIGYKGGGGSITIPYNVTAVGDSALEYCFDLTSVTIPDGVTSIGNFSFHSCLSLAIVTMSNSVASIGQNAFSYCASLASLTIPDSVTYIGEYAFYGCSSLVDVTIPDNVAFIGEMAFEGAPWSESDDYRDYFSGR